MSTSSQHLSSSKGPAPSLSRGFTLIELLVTMAIMVVVTSIMLFNQSKFNSSTLMRSLAYSVALSVHQAQVYGTSVLGTTTPGGLTYASAYGIYFNANTPGQYTLFADLNNNGKYDTGEDIKVFAFGTNYVVSQFCVLGLNSGAQVTRCSPTAISSLSMLFKRPNPDAYFTALDSGGSPIAGDTYGTATVTLQNKGDSSVSNTKTITITGTGLVAVQSPATVNTIVVAPPACRPNWQCTSWGTCSNSSQTCNAYADGCGNTNYTGSAMIQSCITIRELIPVAFTASSNFSSKYTGLSNAGAGMRDGNYLNNNSIHGTNSDASAWIMADLGSAHVITSVTLAGISSAQPDGWGPAWINGALLQGSNDTQNWTTLTTVSGIADNTPSSFTVSGNYRYVRILRINSYIAAGDFRIYGQ